MMRNFSFTLLLAFGLLSACSNPSGAPRPITPKIRASISPQEQQARQLAVSTDNPYWKKRWWLEKTARILRGGQGLLPSEDVESLMKQPEEKILEILSADPRFGLMTLSFNLSFLGFRDDSLDLKNNYSNAYTNAAAISSAKAVNNGGDYLTLLDLDQPIYTSPLVAYTGGEEKKLPDSELLRQQGEKFIQKLDEIIQFAKSEPAPTIADVCKQSLPHYYGNYLISAVNASLGIGFQLSDSWYAPMEQICVNQDGKTLPDLVKALELAQQVNRQVVPLLPPYASDLYKAETVNDIRTIELPPEALGPGWINYSFMQKFGLQNSSTNMNRKRSAYVLKRFFCDDLTPVGVENPAEHTDGKHGSQTSCYSCHYKLDPMAGFFRRNGFFMKDFGGRKKITFDDGATTDLEGYMDNWRAPPGSTRDWNVGYVRSINKDQLNDYGDSLQDLHAILRRAPEVKKCIVKRLFQYMNSDDQTIDGGYLEYLSKEFEKKSKENSSAAFRWVVAQVAMGNTFRNPDPSAGECYDYRPGYQPGSAPPCRVAHILQKNCAGCHSSVYGAGELDLSGWITGPDGKLTFPHEKNGAQQVAASTMATIFQRLSTSEPGKRMPLMKDMPSQERQELYLWAQEQMGSK